MEESSENTAGGIQGERFIIQFKAATGFTVVLEFPGWKELEESESRIVGAGLDCKRIPKFSTQFDQADLYMDMRSPECQVQFELDDWI